MTTRRQILAPQVFTPTQSTPPPSHYLVVFEDTNSYQIAARSSLKKIDGNDVVLMVRNKLLKAKMVHHGSLEECSIEYTRLTRVTQTEQDSQNNDGDEVDIINADNSKTKHVMYSKANQSNVPTSYTTMSRTSKSHLLSANISDNEEENSSDDESQSFFDYRKRTYQQKSSACYKKKKVMETEANANHSTIDSNDEGVEVDINTTHINNITQSKPHLDSNVLDGINNRVDELAQKITLNSSKLDHQMNRLTAKIDRLTSNVNINRFAIEPFVDTTGERFPDSLMYGSTDLLEVLATDYGDYARRILRVLYTDEELKNSILPPARKHLSRKPLDEVRFKIFTDAVRFKFKLNSINFGQFYRTLLRRKLTDFLIEERRREIR